MLSRPPPPEMRRTVDATGTVPGSHPRWTTPCATLYTGANVYRVTSRSPTGGKRAQKWAKFASVA